MNRLTSYLYSIFFSIFPKLFKHKMVRRFFTKNYSTGMLAIGESFSRWKAIGPQWLFSNITNADFQIELEKDSRLPFSNDSMNLIYSAHLIEHLTLEELDNFISECARILKIGGSVRFEAPDAELIIDAYHRKGTLYYKLYRDVRDNLIPRGFDDRYNQEYMGTFGVLVSYVESDQCTPLYTPKEIFDEKIKLPIGELDKWISSLQTEEQKKTHGHNTLIYFDKLKNMFEKCGNFQCHYAAYGESNIPEFSLNNSAQRHKNSIIEGSHRADYSLYFEATKLS